MPFGIHFSPTMRSFANSRRARLFILAGTYGKQDLRPTGKEGGPDRFIIQGTPWSVLFLYKGPLTPSPVNVYTLTHVRFGHITSTSIAKMAGTADQSYLDVITPSEYVVGDIKKTCRGGTQRVTLFMWQG